LTIKHLLIGYQRGKIGMPLDIHVGSWEVENISRQKLASKSIF